MGLGSKIGLGFGALVIIAMALGGIAIWEMRGVGAETEHLDKENVPSVEVANKVERYAQVTMYAMRGYALTLKKSVALPSRSFRTSIL